MEILNNANWVRYKPQFCGDRPTDGRTQTGAYGAPLGTMTKSCATPDPKGLEQSKNTRSMRYALLDESAELLPNERVCKCLRNRITTDSGVTVRYNESRRKAHYSNLQRCGSVWTCPVCSAQISEGRRQELKTALINFREGDGKGVNGGSVYLLTLTNAHHMGDNLKQLIEGQKKALHRFWTLRKPREMFESLGKVGHITATEVTHGVNGWHPHYHILLFFKAPISADALKGFLGSVWQNCCVKSGLKEPSLEHGVDVQEGKYADKYVTKWGIEDEVTKGHIKKGKEGGVTPWDLLRLSQGGCDKSGRLFQVFAQAFKGKRQLSWSKGLKALLGVGEVTDEELATETDKDSLQVKEINMELWRLLLRYKERSAYLDAFEHDIEYGSERADNLIMELAGRYVKEEIDELMKDEGLHKVRAEVLAL